MDKSEVDIASKSIQDIAGFKVQVQQNGYQGGDGGHGGFVKILLQPNDQTYCEFNLVDERGNLNRFEKPQFLELTVCGDSEREVLIRSIEFIISELKKFETKFTIYTINSISFVGKHTFRKDTFSNYMVKLEEFPTLEFRVSKHFFPPNSPYDDSVFPFLVGDKISCEIDWAKMKIQSSRILNEAKKT